MTWLMFLFGVLCGAQTVLMALLWVGVRQVQSERQRLVESRQRGRQ